MVGLILLFIALFFSPVLLTYFVQDDFWLLSISRISSSQEFLNFLKPLADTVWYRPLSSQFFFFFGQVFFGLNPFPYHFMVMMTFLLVTYLVFYLTLTFTHKKDTALLAALIYGVNQIHTVSLGWLATYSFILGPLLILVILIWYRAKAYNRALIVFIFALLATEVTVIVPFLIIVQQKLYGDKYALRRTLPYFFLVGLLVLVRFWLFPTQVMTPLYHTAFLSEFLTTFKFYLFRLAGVPLFINSMPVGMQAAAIIITTFLCGAMVTGAFQCKNLTLQEKKSVWFFGSVGIFGLIPFLFFPFHVAPHYLSFALLGSSPVFAILLIQSKERVKQRLKSYYLIVIVACFIVLQIIGSVWTHQTHWIFKRAILAKKLVGEINLTHPVGSEEYFALGADAAVKVFTGK